MSDRPPYVAVVGELSRLCWASSAAVLLCCSCAAGITYAVLLFGGFMCVLLMSAWLSAEVRLLLHDPDPGCMPGCISVKLMGF
jgi:hypothetical protein